MGDIGWSRRKVSSARWRRAASGAGELRQVALLENEDPDEIPDLFRELGKNLPREQTLADVELIMESVAENYDHYKDYNSTTAVRLRATTSTSSSTSCG